MNPRPFSLILFKSLFYARLSLLQPYDSSSCVSCHSLMRSMMRCLFFPGQELHVNRQNGDAPFFSLAQLDFLPVICDEKDILVGDEDKAPLFMNLLIEEVPEGHELTAHDETLIGDEADEVSLSVNAPQTEQQDGDVVEARRQRRFAEHEPEKIHADQGEDELHEYGKPFGVFKFFFDDAAVRIAAHHILSRNHSPSCRTAS